MRACWGTWGHTGLLFSCGVWVWFCLLGFGSAMEDALLPSNWLALFITGVPAVGGPSGQAPPEREGLAAGRAFFALDCIHGPFRVRTSARGSSLGLYASMGTTGPGIQLWPHSLSIGVLVCRSTKERSLQRPPAHSAHFSKSRRILEVVLRLGAEGLLRTS